MGSTRARAAAAVAVLAAAATGVALAGPGSGKVVRVERRAPPPPGEIEVCNADPGTGPTRELLCLGSIEIGQELEVISELGRYERVRVDAVRPSRFDLCRIGEPVDVEVTSLELSAATGTDLSRRIALGGVDVAPAVSRFQPDLTAVESPSGNPRDGVLAGVELDGDGELDLLVVMSPCDEARRRAPFVANGRLIDSSCIDFWIRDRHGEWRRRNRRHLHLCRS
jgi:hypothetical protein